MTISEKFHGKLLSLVVAVYNEDECIEAFIEKATLELNKLSIAYEIIFIDDGSKDGTCAKIKAAAARLKQIKLIEFSYNHGKELAITAGIRHAKGDYLLYMDPDLQDPPEEIVNFLEKVLEGYDLVFGVRTSYEGGVWENLGSKMFWSTLELLSGLNLPKQLAVMRIFSRRFADKFLEYGEVNRFLEGMFMHVGMKRTEIPVSQHKRYAGTSKFNFRRRMRLALRAVFDYSELPLSLAMRFGTLLVALSVLSALSIIFLKLFFIDFQLGWPSVFVTMALGFGIQIFFIGIVGKYVGNIYKEVKRRPLFSVKELTNLSCE